MKNLAFCFAIIGPVAIAACGDDGGSSTDPDAANGADASGTVDGAPEPDGPGIDSGIPALGTCGVHLDSPQLGLGAGVEVLFSTPEGAIIGVATTDASGDASRDDCVPGTLLTVRMQQFFGIPPGTARLITVADVNPGGTATVMQPSLPAPLGPNTAVAVTLNAAAAPGGTVIYGKQNGCSGSFGPSNAATLSIRRQCEGATAGDIAVLGTALNDANLPIGFQWQEGASFTDDTVVDVDLSSQGWSPPSSFEFQLFNNPVGNRDTNVQLRVMSDEVPMFSASRRATGDSSATLTVPDPGFGDAIEYDARDLVFEGPSVSARRLVGRTGTNTASVGINFDSTMLPAPTSFIVSVPTAGRPVLNWFANEDTSGIPAGVAITRWNDLNGFHSWSVVFSPTGTTGSVQMPIFPDSWGDGVAPLADANFFGNDRVGFADPGAGADYGTVLETLNWYVTFAELGWGFGPPPLAGTSGLSRISTFEPAAGPN